jgi:U3 small nucleolar RNA-associated protein 4
MFVFQAVGKLAVGTEEGFVCLFDVTEEGLDFDRVLDKQEGRILCLDWHTEGKHIVTGSTWLNVTS